MDRIKGTKGYLQIMGADFSVYIIPALSFSGVSDLSFHLFILRSVENHGTLCDHFNDVHVWFYYYFCGYTYFCGFGDQELKLCETLNSSKELTLKGKFSFTVPRIFSSIRIYR